MKLTLIRPNIPERAKIHPPIGLGYISAAAKKAGWDVEIIDAWLDGLSPRAAAYNVFKNSDSYYGVAGIQVYQDTRWWTQDFISSLKTNFGFPGKIIIGGTQVSVYGEQTRKELDADVAVMGEFDGDIESYLNKIVALPPGNKWTFSTPRTDVNKTPRPDYDAMDISRYWPHLNSIGTMKGKRIAVIHRTRGCPFQCTFCSAHSVHGREVRSRDDDNIITEIKYLQKRWNIDEVWFDDDNFIVDYDKGVQLLEKLIPLRIHIRFPNGIRTENIDYTMARMMKLAGVYFTAIGIESGNKRILKRIKKNIHLDKAKRAIEILYKNNINTMGFFIFGLPTETKDDMRDTVKYALDTQLDYAQFGIFKQHPGAADQNEKPLLSANELRKIQKKATLRFHLRPKILFNILRRLTFAQIKAIARQPWIKNWFK